LDKTFTASDARQRLGNAALIGLVPIFAIAGGIGTVAICDVAVRSNGVVATLVALAVIPCLLVAGLASRQALRHASALISTLRWWHCLWLLAFVSALVFRVRGAGEISANPLDGWAIFRIALDGVTAFVLLARLGLRRPDWVPSMCRGLIGGMAVFGLVCLASTVWSVFPPWTLFKSCEYLLDIALLAAVVASIASIDECRSLFNWTWTLYGLVLCSVWIGAFLWPQEGLYRAGFKIGMLGFRLQGVAPDISANDVGTFAAIIGLIALCRLLPRSIERRDSAWYGVLLAGSIVTMICSQTRSALAGFMLGGCLIFLFAKRKGKGALLTVLVTPVAVLSTVSGVIWSFLQRGQTAEEFSSFSSRLGWWSFAWQRFLEQPLTGFGAYAAGRFAVLAQLGNSVTSTMHSDYLEVIVGTSIWGLIPLLAVLFLTWWSLLRGIRNRLATAEEQQLAFEAVAVLALLTFRSIFMTLLTWHPPLHFLALLGFAELLRRRRTYVFAERAWEPTFSAANT
jgi:O-antigen ligase